MPDPDEIRLLASMAGQVTRDLSEAVKNTNKIDPHKFIRDLGVVPPQTAPRSPNIRQTMHIPNMVEMPRSRPAGSEIIGRSNELPALIPTPPGLEKFVEAYVHEDNLPGPVTNPVPTTDPERRIITEPAPHPSPLPENTFEFQVLQRLDRIETLLKNDRKRHKQGKKSKTRSPKASGTRNGVPQSANPTTPPVTSDNLQRENGNGVSEA